jgi:hypothetical protein
MRKAPVGPYTYGTHAHTWRGGAHTADDVRAWEGTVVELTLVSDPDRNTPEQVYPNVVLRVSEAGDGDQWVEVHQVLVPERQPFGSYAMGVELAVITAVRDIVAIRPAATRELVKRDYTAEDLAWLHGRTVTLIREADPDARPLPSLRRLYRRHVLTVPYEDAPEIELHEVVESYVSDSGAEVNKVSRVATLPIEDIAFVMEAR